MNKIICHSIEFVFVHEIESMSGQEVILKPGADWKTIPSIEKPVYRSDSKQNPAGTFTDQSLSAKTRHNPYFPLYIHANLYIILRIHTNEEVLTLGSIEYPFVTEVSSDKIQDDYSFKSQSPFFL
ncbi:hypothetical protein EZS27_004054 [termite gut metagenome]|uniref:Uncharacterized protein n=1 Tax=termite gut metagenome TaxID=433724 RepID=A0A5J4SQL7_9ZZZZ